MTLILLGTAFVLVILICYFNWDRLRSFFRKLFSPQPEYQPPSNINPSSLLSHPELVVPVKINNNEDIIEGINGEPYYSEKNGFQQAANADGNTAIVPKHITILIHNEKHIYNKEELETEIGKLEEDIRGYEEEITDISDKISNNQKQVLTLESIRDLQKSIIVSDDEIQRKEMELIGLEKDLEPLPDGGPPKHKSVKLYPLLGIVCILLSLALYFFYVAALDKGFGSNIPIASEGIGMELYANLNELFDPTAFFRAIQEGNFWLLLYPIFPLALVLLIHPLWTSAATAAKQERSGNKIMVFCWVLGIIIILAATFVFDSILSLRISEKIHGTKVLIGEIPENSIWEIKPLNPLTWDLTIYLVLFCGFVVSLVLSALFHFTMEMWIEARRYTDDRNDIVKQIAKIEANIKNKNKNKEQLILDLKDLKENHKDQGMPIDASLPILETEIEDLKSRIEADREKVRDIDSEIVKCRNLIDDKKGRLNSWVVDKLVLDAHIDSFLIGWSKFLVAQKGENGATEHIEEVRSIATKTLSEFLNIKEGRII